MTRVHKRVETVDNHLRATEPKHGLRALSLLEVGRNGIASRRCVGERRKGEKACPKHSERSDQTVSEWKIESKKLWPHLKLGRICYQIKGMNKLLPVSPPPNCRVV